MNPADRYRMGLPVPEWAGCELGAYCPVCGNLLDDVADGAGRCWWETKDDDIRPELGRIIRQAVAGDLPTFRLRGPLTLDFNDDATLRRTA